MQPFFFSSLADVKTRILTCPLFDLTQDAEEGRLHSVAVQRVFPVMESGRQRGTGCELQTVLL